jgi:hypothetical protein
LLLFIVCFAVYSNAFETSLANSIKVVVLGFKINFSN